MTKFKIGQHISIDFENSLLKNYYPQHYRDLHYFLSDNDWIIESISHGHMTMNGRYTDMLYIANPKCIEHLYTFSTWCKPIISIIEND